MSTQRREDFSKFFAPYAAFAYWRSFQSISQQVFFPFEQRIAPWSYSE